MEKMYFFVICIMAEFKLEKMYFPKAKVNSEASIHPRTGLVQSILRTQFKV